MDTCTGGAALSSPDVSLTLGLTWQTNPNPPPWRSAGGLQSDPLYILHTGFDSSKTRQNHGETYYKLCLYTHTEAFILLIPCRSRGKHTFTHSGVDSHMHAHISKHSPSVLRSLSSQLLIGTILTSFKHTSHLTNMASTITCTRVWYREKMMVSFDYREEVGRLWPVTRSRGEWKAGLK